MTKHKKTLHTNSYCPAGDRSGALVGGDQKREKGLAIRPVVRNIKHKIVSANVALFLLDV